MAKVNETQHEHDVKIFYQGYTKGKEEAIALVFALFGKTKYSEILPELREAERKEGDKTRVSDLMKAVGDGTPSIPSPAIPVEATCSYNKGYADGFKAGQNNKVHGKWVKNKSGYMVCSECGSRGSAIKARFCHHCGADMRGET